MARSRRVLWVAACIALMAGCSGRRTDSFDIEVRNATSQPLTLSLAKDGPPYEPAWATPQDLAIETPKRREQWSGGPSGMGAVPAGKTASVAGLRGQFDSGVSGYLRIYGGELTISEMLARGSDSPGRVDVRLSPGANRIVITERAGRLVAEPAK